MKPILIVGTAATIAAALAKMSPPGEVHVVTYDKLKPVDPERFTSAVIDESFMLRDKRFPAPKTRAMMRKVRRGK